VLPDLTILSNAWRSRPALQLRFQEKCIKVLFHAAHEGRHVKLRRSELQQARLYFQQGLT
jgi:hypothetical protein